jgi:hypothetical protein
MRNLMAHTQKPDFVFRLNGQVHLNRRGSQFRRLLAVGVCASAVVMQDTPRSEIVWEYWLPTPFASFPFTSPPVRRVPPHSERSLPYLYIFILLYEFLYFLLYHLFKVEYRFNLLKRIYYWSYSFPKSRNNISRDFPQESEVMTVLLRDFSYLYKVGVYQIKFDGSQASCLIGTTNVYLWHQSVSDGMP